MQPSQSSVPNQIISTFAATATVIKVREIYSEHWGLLIVSLQDHYLVTKVGGRG